MQPLHKPINTGDLILSHGLTLKGVQRTLAAALGLPHAVLNGTTAAERKRAADAASMLLERQRTGLTSKELILARDRHDEIVARIEDGSLQRILWYALRFKPWGKHFAGKINPRIRAEPDARVKEMLRTVNRKLPEVGRERPAVNELAYKRGALDDADAAELRDLVRETIGQQLLLNNRSPRERTNKIADEATSLLVGEPVNEILAGKRGLNHAHLLALAIRDRLQYVNAVLRARTRTLETRLADARKYL